MATARHLILLGAAAWLAACAETNGPPPGGGPLVRADGQLHHLRWQPVPEPRAFVATGGTLMRSPGQLGAAAGGVAGPVLLDQYRLSFWAYPDRDRSVLISYRAGDGSWQPYLSLAIPKGSLARWPDGRPVVAGDSVLITVRVDTVSLVVEFEPSGLQFSAAVPAELVVWYTGANPDLDASGTVDAVDQYIEQQLLHVWVQEAPGQPWAALEALHSLAGKVFRASLAHFSGYAVSW